MCGHYHTEKLPHSGEISLTYIMIYFSCFCKRFICLYVCHMFQWMERKPDGGVVFRSVRAEEKEARRYNNHKQKAMEVLFAKIQAEFEKEEKGRNHVCSMLHTD